ncbi:MAG: hypothetical protein EPO65_01180 [Dehalococcoidia bacterium]|nr:MAG: hypothetical protein EPO65_01180 [Dehalococcoidia bacterium]
MNRWKTPPAGSARETAASLSEAAAEELDEFRDLFVERQALESSAEYDSARLSDVRRRLGSLAPAVQRHLETLGGALVAFEDARVSGRTRRDPLPLTYIAAFGGPEDYAAHGESLVGALETAAERYRSGEGGEERLERRRRRRRSSRSSRAMRRVLVWGAVAVLALTFYVVGLMTLGDWSPGGAPDPVPPVEASPGAR